MPDEALDRLTRLVADALTVPVALVSFVDQDRQSLESCVDVGEPRFAVDGTSLSNSFCRSVAESRELLLVEDARVHPLAHDEPRMAQPDVVAFAGAPIFDDDGRALGALCAIDHQPRRWTEREIRILTSLASCVMTELHARRRAETGLALRESEERYRLAARATRDVLWDWDLVHDTVVWTESLEYALGYQLEDATSSISFWYDHIHPDDRASVIAGMHEVIDGDGDHWTSSYRFMRRDGTYAHVIDRGFVVRNPEGRAVRMVGAMHDDSLRVEALASVQANTRRLADILEAVPAGIFVADPSGEAMFVNQAARRILQRGPAHGLRSGQSPLAYQAYVAGTDELFPADRMPIARALTGETVTTTDLEIRHGHTTTPLHVQSAPIRDLDGNIVAAVAAFVDVSEQKRLSEQLRQASKMEAVGRLAGGVAHDFNNLLAVIQGTASLMLYDITEPPHADDLREILRAAERAAEMTRQLLAFSRQQVLRPRPLDLCASVEEMTRMLGRLLSENISLVTELSPDTGSVLADPSQMEQVLLNLAVNARDAMPLGGTLRISTENVDITPESSGRYPSLPAPGEYVLLRVSDTGSGIDRETQKRIFEPFFTTKEHGHGTGLGLATVHGIVEQSGGHIWVESAPRQGTTFSILLPRLPETSPVAAPGGRQGEAQRGSETILVVEDQESLRRLIKRMLRGIGYSVAEAANAADAMHVVQSLEGAVDLLIADVALPGMDGRTLAQCLRGRVPGLPVLFVSGLAGDVALQRMVEGRDESFLQAPFSPEQLSEAVRAALRGAGHRAPTA